MIQSKEVNIITPDEVIAILNGYSNEHIKDALSKINALLLKNGRATFSLQNLPLSIKTFCIKEITSRLEKAGWTVKRDNYCDYRDSWDNLQISSPQIP